jgi:methylenetetrahydrofolate dehydrogenase (NADP+)/methenyltetrahydrofolate cyclohydrolase
MRIDPAKDADGFHRSTSAGCSSATRCPPRHTARHPGMLLRSGNDPRGGKHVVIVGRSQQRRQAIGGHTLQKKKGANATVTICHSRTRDLESIVRTGDHRRCGHRLPAVHHRGHVKPGAWSSRRHHTGGRPTAKKGYPLVGTWTSTRYRRRPRPSPRCLRGGPDDHHMLMKNTVTAACRAAASSTVGRGSAIGTGRPLRPGAGARSTSSPRPAKGTHSLVARPMISIVPSSCLPCSSGGPP